MEIIRNYLESMFMQLPDTPEVRRAREELWQMMEDKYNELITEGKTKNEAVGTVISEFGNLSELAESLGIDTEVTATSARDTAPEVIDTIASVENTTVKVKEALTSTETNTVEDGTIVSTVVTSSPAVRNTPYAFGTSDDNGETYGAKKKSTEYAESEHITYKDRRGQEMRLISYEEIRAWLDEHRQISMIHGLIAVLGIICPIGLIIGSSLEVISMGRMGIAFGFIFLAACIAGIVFLSVISGTMNKQWQYLFKGNCVVDRATVEYVDEKKSTFQTSFTIRKVLGILCCSLCFVPLVVVSILGGNAFVICVGVAILLMLVAGGVFLITIGESEMHDYDRILGLNDGNSISGNYVPSQEQARVTADGSFLDILLSVYWPTVTCIYFAYSFLTFNWATSWIIWCIAAIVEKVLRRSRKRFK